MDYRGYLESEAWKSKAQKRMEIDNFECCVCGSRGTMRNRLEIHHLSYRHIGSEDIYAELVTVCRSCHQSLHVLMSRKTSADGRRGWKDEAVPKISVYTTSGGDMNYRLEDDDAS